MTFVSSVAKIRIFCHPDPRDHQRLNRGRWESLCRPCGTLFVVLWFCGGLRADEPVKLRYKPIKGETTVYSTESGLKQTQTMMDMTTENTLSQETITVRTVDQIDKQGNAHFTIKTERLRIKMKLGLTGDYEFDSRSKTQDRGTTLGQALTPLYERLGSARIQVVLSPRGEVVSVKGFAELVAAAIKNNPLAAQFAGGGTDVAARFATQESFIVMNEAAVQAGEKWEAPIDVDLPNIGKNKRKERVTFVGLEKVNKSTAARLLLSTDITTEIHTDSKDSKLNGTLSTTQSDGAALFDLKTGRLVSMRTVTTLAGKLTLEVNKMTIPIQQEQTQTLEVELLDKLPD